jgi:hypothetical protein
MSIPCDGKRPSCRAVDPTRKDKERVKRKKSKRQERRVASALGGKVTPLSGADKRAKGDVEVGDKFLVEAKRTDAASIRVTAAWLRKITREAMAVGADPALAIEMDVGNDGLVERDWVLIPRSVFSRLKDDEGL